MQVRDTTTLAAIAVRRLPASDALRSDPVALTPITASNHARAAVVTVRHDSMG